LFGDLSKSSFAQSGGLFGKLGGAEKKEDSSSAPKLFSNTGSNNLFSGSSLFSASSSGSTSLFANTSSSSSLFGSKPLFNFSSLGSTNNFVKKDDEDKSDEEGGDENDLFQSNSPNPYNPLETSTVSQSQEKSIYTKKYVKEIDNIFVYSKEENKFVSKGKAFLSLEYADADGKKVGVVVFR